MPVPDAHLLITDAVTAWPGVSTVPHRFGGVEYRLGTREIGHIHGDHLVDIPFPKAVRDDVVASGDAEPHHILPESGWVSFYLREPSDVNHAIVLLHRSFVLAREKQDRQAARSSAKAVPARLPNRPAGPEDQS